jgi:hypothetical protein
VRNGGGDFLDPAALFLGGGHDGRNQFIDPAGFRDD